MTKSSVLTSLIATMACDFLSSCILHDKASSQSLSIHDQWNVDESDQQWSSQWRCTTLDQIIGKLNITPERKSTNKNSLVLGGFMPIFPSLLFPFKAVQRFMTQTCSNCRYIVHDHWSHFVIADQVQHFLFLLFIFTILTKRKSITFTFQNSLELSGFEKSFKDAFPFFNCFLKRLKQICTLTRILFISANFQRSGMRLSLPHSASFSAWHILRGFDS